MADRTGATDPEYRPSWARLPTRRVSRQADQPTRDDVHSYCYVEEVTTVRYRPAIEPPTGELSTDLEPSPGQLHIEPPSSEPSIEELYQELRPLAEPSPAHDTAEWSGKLLLGGEQTADELDDDSFRPVRLTAPRAGRLRKLLGLG